MGKGKDKRKKGNLKKGEQDRSAKTLQQIDSTVSPAGSAYGDGVAFDQVQYLEAKLILKPDRFTSVEAFRDFGKIVKRTAKELGVGRGAWALLRTVRLD